MDQEKASYFKRVLTNDSTKRGVAAAGAGVLVACIIEAFWPSARSSICSARASLTRCNVARRNWRVSSPSCSSGFARRLDLLPASSSGAATARPTRASSSWSGASSC